MTDSTITLGGRHFTLRPLKLGQLRHLLDALGATADRAWRRNMKLSRPLGPSRTRMTEALGRGSANSVGRQLLAPAVGADVAFVTFLNEGQSGWT